MKTENHGGTHAPKVTRGINAPKVADSATKSVSKDADAEGSFLTLLAQLETVQSTPSLVGADAELPNGLTGSEIAANLAGESGLDLSLGASADNNAILAQMGQGFVRSLDSAVVGGAGKANGDSSVRPWRGVPGGLKAGDMPDAAIGVKMQNAGDALSELKTAAFLGKGEGGTDTKTTSSKVLGHSKPDGLQGQMLSAAQEVRHDKYLHLAQVAELSELSVALNPVGAMDGALRQAERALAKVTTTRSSEGVDGVWGSQAFFSGSPQGIEPANSTEAMVAPELAVAEQVKYWISQDVQNAELKLDGFDGLPVDVSITLKGNEASVDFRTDEEGIREVLQSTEAYLKDMLAKEGLVLSGVSIGASLQQGNKGSSHDRAPDSRRKMEVSMVSTSSVASLRQSSAAAGNSIDVFV